MTNQDRGACLQASLGAPPISVTEISPKTEDITAETSNKNTGCYAECPTWSTLTNLLLNKVLVLGRPVLYFPTLHSASDQRMLTLTITDHMSGLMSSLNLQSMRPYRFGCNLFHTLVMRLESRSLT